MEKKKDKEELREKLERFLKESLYLSNNGRISDDADKVAIAIVKYSNQPVLEEILKKIDLNGGGRDDIKLMWNLTVGKFIIFLKDPSKLEALEEIQKTIRLFNKIYSSEFLRFKIAQILLYVLKGRKDFKWEEGELLKLCVTEEERMFVRWFKRCF